MLRILPKITPRVVSRGLLSALRRGSCDAFERRLSRAASVQRDWLLNRVRLSEQTGFGKDYGFQHIRSLDDFRKQVPVAGYDHFEPYINRVAAGETSALIPETEKLLQFTITTGSSGVPKLNPVTNTWLREYRKAWDVWGMKLFVDHPRHIGSKMLQMSGTWDMGTTPGGHQISMVSSLLTKIQNPMLKPYYLIPDVVNDIPDPVTRHYVALRLTLLEDVGWILLMNPGTLIRLAEIGDTHSDTLLRDISDGTLTDKFDIPSHIRRVLETKHLKRSVAGARRLSQLASQRGRLLPRDYWNTPVIGCWLAGTAGYQSRNIPQYFGDSPCRDMGLVSSEGRHTIPLQDTNPAGVPSIESGYYEFIPMDEPIGEFPHTLSGHELEPGHEYRLVMTTAAGYFRFDIGDIVKCCGFTSEAPLLEFVQKSARVGDLEGEKLTEHQVVAAAHMAAEQIGVNLSLITAVPRRLEHRQPRYDFLVESTEISDARQAERFLCNLDERLEELNFLWRARRREGVLQAPHLTRLAPREWDRCIQKEVAKRGTGDYQYKHPGLVMDEQWLDQFHVHDTITMQPATV
ncbi:GH3 auxin-responsive promoter family protein [Fuerstiella marisgermanici]|uniref:GH3 auxin-responsive promoter n=1 Tax=Fuerstiella marisgermanici TaxID=1891926 RepID=A0A1P8WMH7_9PLAN|nr:GH3 auxin-responsive promoter family protein [Fuerstiella marisgermanici]APZ95276.1 GH3 auxin-responsive promoter [Fuerstiella marisgermanici]